MSYDLIQSALTATIEFVAIAGFGGIIAHAFITSHCRWMATYCPPVTPFVEETNSDADSLYARAKELEELAQKKLDKYPLLGEDIKPLEELAIAPVAAPVETDEDNSTSKYFELEKEETVQSEIELSALDSTILRNLCTQHGITWKNVRGKGKHLTKAAMIFQLQRLTA